MDEKDTELLADEHALMALLLAEEGFDLSHPRSIPPRTKKEHPPLSFAQERLWFLDQLVPGVAAYNIASAFRLRGPLNIHALERSLNEIVRRHESLRTTFTKLDEQLVQAIAPGLKVPLQVRDLQHLPAGERETTAICLLKAEAAQPFSLNLAAGSLLRVLLLRVAVEEYLLSLVVHHSVSDAWSMNVFLRELSALYTAFTANQPSPLPEVALHYADVAVWQRDWLQGDVLAEQLRYWREQLSGAPALLNLPTNRPRPPMQSFRGAMTSTLMLPDVATRQLLQISQQEGVTFFMTLLAAFQVLLLRYTGQEDLVVGTPIANRSRVELEDVMGYLVNMLALRSHLQGNPPFTEVLKQARDVVLGAYEHQDLPFEKVVEALQPERALSHSPLFQVMFILQNAVEPLHLANLQTTLLEVDSDIAKFDLTLFVWEKAEQLALQMEYNTDLFDADTIERLVTHYRQLLLSIITAPEQRIAHLTLLPPPERQRLLVEWNATSADYPEHRCVHELFAAQAEHTPEAVALVCEEQQLTYQQLHERSNQLACSLQKLGVGPEVLVGICMNRSIEMVVGLLGILKAGGAYIPLDPSYPRERLAYMLRDAHVSVLLTQQRLQYVWPEQLASTLCLDSDWQAISRETGTAPSCHVQADNLMYVIYTSGSTGKPKGVQITHQAVVNFLTSMRQRPALSEQDTLLTVTSLSFDIAGLELFLPLLTGARLEIATREVAKDAQQLSIALQRSGATCMQATPATWRLLLETAWSGKQDLKMLCGGEALPPDLAAQLLTKGSSLWNMYGPTETTIWSAVERVEYGTGPVPLGRPIANTQLYLLDTHLEPVPIGAPGDLYIGGDGLSRGYLHRPALTAERFMPHPFTSRPGSRLYKTGDLARYHADGRLEFLGRGDSQVKVRGFRIELGEIEAVLAEHPAVRASVVLAREDTPGEKRLVAYIVSRNEQSDNSNGKSPLAADQLRRHVQEQLPEYMVPSAFVMLEALPLTPNGKVDRRPLPAPEDVASPREETYVAPRTPVEEVLAQLWAQVLRVDLVGMYDNFFALGGHSLLATQVISRVRRTFQVELPLHSLFEAPTIAAFAEKLLTYETKAGRLTAIAQLRKKIDTMSPDEKRARLQATKKN